MAIHSQADAALAHLPSAYAAPPAAHSGPHPPGSRGSIGVNAGASSRPSREPLQCPYCDERHPQDCAICPNTGQTVLLDEKYRLKKLLGEGSFGLVWDARNIATQKDVAIKSLRAEVLGNPEVLGRFLWEATAAGRVRSAHVCDVLDLVDSSVHGPYIVLERLTGRGLDAYIQERVRIDPGEAVTLIRQALAGLDAVHQAGIVHRDLKPENIFLHEPKVGRILVKLLDFGISKFSSLAGDKARTAENLFMGTPEYMSPEQARGGIEVDARTDLWAIGAILYKAMSGVGPFQGPDIPSILAAIIHAPHTPLNRLALQIPDGLSAVVDRCLSKDRDLRYSSCDELNAALEPFEGRSLARTVVDAQSVLIAAPGGARDEGRTKAPPADSGAAGPVLLGCNVADRRWLIDLRRHLQEHPEGRRLSTLDCGEFEPGTGRYEAFAGAGALVLLASSRFLAEDFVPGAELYAFALTAHGRGLPVLWLAVDDVDPTGTELEEFQAVGDRTRPLERMSSTAASFALAELCEQIVASMGISRGAPAAADGQPTPVKTQLAEAAVREPPSPPSSPTTDAAGKAASVVALVKAFARHAEESQLPGDASDLVAGRETSEISEPPAAPPRLPQPPAPSEGRTSPDGGRPLAPGTIVALAVGAGVVALLLYFMLSA